MVASLRRNLDQDLSGNERVLNAPISTNFVESGFGVFDSLFNKPGAPAVEQACGQAQSRMMHTMANTSELEKQAEATVKKRLCRGVGVSTKDEKWLQQKREHTNWRQALPREKRFQILKSLQRNLRVHAQQRREKREEVANKAIERKKQGVEAAVNRRLRAIAKYCKHESTVPITTEGQFVAFKGTHAASGDPVNAWGELLRNQTRVRMHVYERVSEQQLPRLGSGSSVTLRSLDWKKL